MTNAYSKTEKYTVAETLEDFYSDYLPLMKKAIQKVLTCIESESNNEKGICNRESIEHIKSRIKSPESMRNKLERKRQRANAENALSKVQDACGVRVVCTFLNDVFNVVDILKNPEFEIWEEKDYIHNPKSNGYRSYHLILLVPVDIKNVSTKIYVEIQIRTIAMDCWASLEHQLKYKQEIPNQALFIEELKRCSNEIASTDLNLQTLRNMIDREKENSEGNNLKIAGELEDQAYEDIVG